MKKFFACILVLTILTAGCTGSFNVTRKIYDVHRSQKEKWVDEGLFLALSICQVYSFALIADAIVLNSIEFWTGKNPVQFASNDGNHIVIDLKNKKMISQANSFTLVEEASNLVLKNDAGQTVCIIEKGSGGDYRVYDREMNLVNYYDMEQYLAKNLKSSQAD